MEVDTMFLKTLRGRLKIVELLAAFVAFVCFAVAAERPYIAAAGLEFFITLAFLLLYLLKLNKRFSYLCWPLMDVANSLVAAVFIFIISLVAVSTYSAKGTLIGGVLTFITFVCFVASSAAVFTTAPLVEFLMAIFFYFAYSTKFNERFKDFYWPLVDFLRCVTASIIYFIISIISVSKYSGGASSAAGVFGFIATIVFAIDFYFIFNDLATFLKQGRTPDEEPQAANDSDSDSD
ncbi:CKLF-like MARVEL transmembrane domain-containing protein 3 isoform X1 [Paramormyrops kingsleyae]|uniref:CKLF-like MARVEL transmembrane domain-containing protein 3 isoform X1 n=1 Tax=Paramormyrops kingsleyae TaxID=1676925 RepID=UPI003B9749FD